MIWQCGLTASLMGQAVGARATFERILAKNSNVTLMPDASPPRFSAELNLFTLPELDESLDHPLKLYPAQDKWSVIDVRLATLNTQQALVLAVDDQEQWFADRFDLKTGRQIARTPVPAETQLLDFRPDGKFWLSLTQHQPWRLRIWETSAENSKQADANFTTLEYERHQACVAACFSGHQRVLSSLGSLTSNASRLESGRMDFVSPRVGRKVDNPVLVARDWNEPEPLYSRPLHSNFCVSPGRRYFVDVADSRVAFFDAADGMLVGHLPQSHVPAETFLECQFRADGRKLAIRNGSGVEIWDLVAQKCDALLAIESCFYGWRGDFAQSDGNVIYVPGDVAVWQLAEGYKYNLCEHMAYDTWCIRSNGRDVLLCRTKLPGNTLSSEFPSYLETIRMPLETVSLRTSVSWARADRSEDDLNRRLQQALTESLEKNGMQLDQVADTRLTVTLKCLGQKLSDRMETISVSGQEPFLAFDNGKQFFIVYDDLFQVTVEAQNRNMGRVQLAQIDFRLSACDYQLDWQAENPQHDLERQAETGLIQHLCSLPWSRPWIGDRMEFGRDPRNYQLGQSQWMDGRNQHLLIQELLERGKSTRDQPRDQ